MKRLILDEDLEVLISKVEAKHEFFWQQKALPFLESLRNKYSITRKQHNWLSQIRSQLKEPWEQ